MQKLKIYKFIIFFLFFLNVYENVLKVKGKGEIFNPLQKTKYRQNQKHPLNWIDFEYFFHFFVSCLQSTSKKE